MIPGVGLLDQNRNAQKQDTELLILVTPRMVRLAPRKDHVIYAGQGSRKVEGRRSSGNTRLPSCAPPQAPAAESSAPGTNNASSSASTAAEASGHCQTIPQTRRAAHWNGGNRSYGVASRTSTG